MTGGVSVWQAVLLGIVQGLTEWLPVSSSGHLVLTQAAFGIQAPVVFDLLLHVGTLLVVLFFFRATIARMIRRLVALPRDVRAGATWREALDRDPERRLALLVAIGSLPTAILGLTLESRIESAFESTTAVGAALLFTGALLFATRYAPTVPRELTRRHAVLVGLAQGLALFPGVSRSGATISAGMLLGVDRERAVEYSFLLAIPVIAGATLLKGLDPLNRADVLANVPAYAAGIAAAMVVGYASLLLLVLIVKRRGFHHFAYYCWAVGAVVLVTGL